MPTSTPAIIDASVASVLVAALTGATMLISKYLDRRWKQVDDEKSAQKSAKNTLYPAIAEAGQIRIQLHELLQEFQPDRISVVQFHNGGTFYSGKHMQRMTMTYELSRRRGLGIKDDVQGTIVSGAQLVWLDEVIRKKGVYYPETDTLEDGEIRDFWLYYKVGSVCVLPLYDKQARLVGLLSLSASRRDFLRDATQVGIRLRAAKIETLLIEK